MFNWLFYVNAKAYAKARKCLLLTRLHVKAVSMRVRLVHIFNLDHTPPSRNARPIQVPHNTSAFCPAGLCTSISVRPPNETCGAFFSSLRERMSHMPNGLSPDTLVSYPNKWDQSAGMASSSFTNLDKDDPIKHVISYYVWYSTFIYLIHAYLLSPLCQGLYKILEMERERESF